MNHLAYCLDKNYEQHFGASLMSLLLCDHMGEDLTIHVVIDKPTFDFEVKIAKLNKQYRSNIVLHALHKDDLDLLCKLPTKSDYIKHVSLASMFRLALGRILDKGIEKILYVDSDTIFLSSPVDLFDVDLNECIVAGVESHNSESHKIRLNQNIYINAGVILIDLFKWRHFGVMEDCFNVLLNRPNDVPVLDQDAINIALSGRVMYLQGKWNRQITMRTRLSDLSEGGILHYITHLKPWQEWYDNSLDSYYWSCINVSPWRNALPIKATTHQEYRLLAAKLFRQEKFKESAMILDRVANYLFKEKLSK